MMLSAAVVTAAATAAGAGCAVNHSGLDIQPDAAAPVDVRQPLDSPPADPPVERPPADLPVDVPPVDDGGGGDLGCAPCDGVSTFIPLPGGRFTGTTAGASAAQGSCGGGQAPEAVFKIQLGTPSDLFITSHGSGFDTVVYLRRGCCGDEVACSDDADDRPTSLIAARALAAGTYYIYVDGAGSADAGDFTLDVYATPAATHTAEACGNAERIGANPVTGDTCGAHDDYSPPPGCSSAVSGPHGLDQVYYFVLDAPAMVTFSTCNDTCIDTVLYIRDVCSDGASQRGCDDDDCRASGSCLPEGNQVQSRLARTLGAGVHYLVLDTFAASQIACGGFTITPTGVP
jgi:hypothetical protein